MTSGDPVDLADAIARWEAGTLRPLPASDGEVAEVRDELEAAAAAAAAAAGDADLATNPIRLSKRRVAELSACERHLLATAAPATAGLGGDDDALHLGVLVDVLAEHFAVSGRAEPDPEPLLLGEALCRAHGDKEDTLAWLAGLGPDRRGSVAERLDEKRAQVLAGWPAIAGRWWPRTQERAVVGLAAGQIVLDGRTDVTLGGPPTPWPALVIEVKSGGFTLEQRDDGLFYGLLLALRDGSAPAAAVTVAPGHTHVELVTGDRLRTAGRRLADLMVAAGELAGGRAPTEVAGFRCERCPAATGCATGQAWLGDRDDPR